MKDAKRNNLRIKEFEKFIEFATRKTAIAKKYNSAKSIDDLIYFVSEQMLIAVIPIMFSLKGPKRGNLILKILKKLKPESYYAYWNRNNKLFSECLIFVVDKFKKFVENYYHIKLNNDLIARLATQTGVVYYSTLHMDEGEKEMFKNVMAKTIISYEDNPLTEHNDFLKRIIEAHGEKPTTKELAKLLQETTVRDPLVIIEPWDFIENYKRFMS